jgi:cytochrome P450
VKDFNHFVDRHASHILEGSRSKTDMVWPNMMSNLRGDRWKEVRSAFRPVFTSSKIKMMMPMISGVCKDMERSVDCAAKTGDLIDLKDLCGKYSMDTIASCVFGVDAGSFDSLAADSSPFIRKVKALFNKNGIEAFKIGLTLLPGVRELMLGLRIPLFKPDETRFFVDVIAQTLRDRKARNKEQNGSGRKNDLIDLMIDAIGDDPNAEQHDLIVANAMLMMIAGYDTTAATMSYCFWHLAKNPDIQIKMQREIDQASREEEDETILSYEAIQKLEYLDIVVKETLRLHAPVGQLFRRCTAEKYVVPGTDVTLRAGDEVLIPLCGIHLDERHYPDPERFDPDRFAQSSPSDHDPFAFLSFGHGPRGCIGTRFALLEAKAALASVLKKYSLKAVKETPVKVTLDPRSIFSDSKEALLVRAEKR